MLPLVGHVQLLTFSRRIELRMVGRCLQNELMRYTKIDDCNVEPRHVLVMTKMTRMSGLLEALAMRFANQGGWRPCNKISNEAFV